MLESLKMISRNFIAPKFSVVIPLYNKQNSILSTLESVIQQKYPADEIIIIDDGSTDTSVDLVKQKGIKNLRIIQQKNQGVSAARNKGIEVAKHDHIAFLDADDQWLPLYLDEIALMIEKFPSSLMYCCRYQCREKNGDIVDAKIRMGNKRKTFAIMENYFEIASQGDLPFMISSTVAHKSLFDNIGNFPVGETMGEDQDLFCRSVKHQAIAYSSNIHLIYNRNTENRACENNIPDRECPFSVRLYKSIDSRDKNKKYFIKKYCATHLLHLVKLNIAAGKLSTAKSILSDKRCYLRPKHYLYFTIKLKIKDLIEKCYWVLLENKIYKNS